ncbi:MAG: phytase [Saprospiraceae bacterium]|nr:phytase [Saprospiraceae bacterium]
MTFHFLSIFIGLLFSCTTNKATNEGQQTLSPDFTTDTTLIDTDDPAIWINYDNPMQSLLLGTDKGEDNGGIYVFDIQGNMIKEKCLLNLPRPNNIDVAYNFIFDSDTIDIAVFTQRNGDNIRVLRLPDMTFIDGGGIPVFVGDTVQSPMGIALYQQPTTGAIYAIVSRKNGADGSYLWQYLLKDSLGVVIVEPVRKFGAFKGGKEIESVAVDNELGHIYYSDEGSGVRKYYADPDSSNVALAFFANQDFKEDHEGISIYKTGATTGYILVSDQQANQFHVFTREVPHQRIAIVPVSTNESDGSEATNMAFGNLFPKGFFVAMSDNRTFQIYNWEKFEAAILAQTKN